MAKKRKGEVKLIMPKHTASVDHFKYALKVCIAHPGGVDVDTFKDELFAELHTAGIEVTKNNDGSHYTKCLQLPRYFGLVRYCLSGERANAITKRGIDVYTALTASPVDNETLHRCFLESIVHNQFGQGNEGVGSESFCEPMAIFFRAAEELDGIENQEYGYLIQEMDAKGRPYGHIIQEIRTSRASGLMLQMQAQAQNISDWKAILFLVNIGFLVKRPDGRVVLSSSLPVAYRMRLMRMPLYGRGFKKQLFMRWMESKNLGQSVLNYADSLEAITEDGPGKDSARFCGFYECLTGGKSAKKIYDVVGLEDYKKTFGALELFWSKGKDDPPYPFEEDRYYECYYYAKGTKRIDNARLENACQQYKQFLSFYDTHKEVFSAEEETMYTGKLGSIQKIVYGAPGTGKSFDTDGKLKDEQGNQKAECYRTTFHPDSDYSTFVGAYKPTMEGEKIAYKFRPQAFMEAYVAAWKEHAKGVGGKARTDNVKKPYSGLNKVMADAVAAFIAEGGKDVVKTRKEIIAKAMELSGGEYDEKSFVPSDYCYNRVNGAMTLTRPALFEFLGDGKYKCRGADDASYSGDIVWREKYGDGEKVVGKCTAGVRTLNAEEAGKPVVLVIEEINRGNCAQIFGDLFQLLDRGESGYSSYPINADKDLSAWLAEDEQFGAGLDVDKSERPACITEDDWSDVLKGRKLALPPKLYIWATMNTSDQSLFPIDSAFKRRWDWQYVPITNHPDKDYKIEIGSDQYDWWDFLTAINDRIWSATDSEDKKLGYFFVKAQEKGGKNLITVDRFVNKVIFYLWNDVFKNSDPEKAFKFKKPDGKDVLVTFQEFFNKDDGKIDEGVVKGFIEGLGVKTVAAKSAPAASQTAGPAAGQPAAASAPTAPAANS